MKTFTKKESMEDQKIFEIIFNEISTGYAFCELLFDDQGRPNDYRFLRVNPAFETQSRLNAKSTVGKTIKEIFPDIEQSWIDKFGSVVINNKPIQFIEFNHNTNKYYRVNAFSPGGNKFVMNFEDVTKEKKAEEELKKSKNDYKLIVDSMLEMFKVIELIFDEEGNVIDYYFLQVNPALEKLFNKDKSELIGKRAKEIFGIVEDYWLKTYQRVEKTGKSEKFENYGAELDRHYSINVWKVGEGQVALTFYDITKHKKLEKELIKAKEKAEESDRLKSAFLSNMSHEIRTPMNGILGFADLLNTPNISPEDQGMYIGIIEKSSTRLLNIINDIIDISKIESGQMEAKIGKSNVNEQIKDIYNFFKPEVESKGIQFSYKNSLPFEKAILITDKEKLFAILTNLVKNAIKFCEKGTIEIGYTLKGEYLEFYVKDSGLGIKKESQKSIFKRFIQADISNSRAYEGAGLGLSISKAYVEMLGGQIWVESEIQKGAIFYFTLPFISKEQEIVETPNSLVGVQGENLKILIVEDDEVSSLFLSIILQEIGSTIHKATNGIEAIEIFQKNPDIDLILMDINMPIMDGYDATKKIREQNKEVIIIAQTGFGLTADKEKTIEVGCNEYLSKPIVKKELFLFIQQYFS